MSVCRTRPQTLFAYCLQAGFYTILLNITIITQYYQYYMMLLIQLAHCRFQLSLVLLCIALILLWACHQNHAVCHQNLARVCIFTFTVAAQYTLSQDNLETPLNDEELDSYLLTFVVRQSTESPYKLFTVSKCKLKFLIFQEKGHWGSTQ